MDDEKKEHENEYDINKPQYKEDMNREEKSSRRIGKEFKENTGFSNACKKGLS